MENISLPGHDLLLNLDQYQNRKCFLSENILNLFDSVFNSSEYSGFLFLQNDLTIINDHELISIPFDFENEHSKHKLGLLLNGIDYEFSNQINCLNEIKQILQPNLQWLGNDWNLYILDAIDLAFDKSQPVEDDDEIYLNQLLSLYLFTSGMEHCLGDLCLQQHKHLDHVPPLMKDLIELPELQKTIGKSLQNVLRAILGPPTTLNIRNILWHGFVNYKCPSFHPRPLICTLIVLMASIGSRIKPIKHSNLEIKQIPMYNLDKFNDDLDENVKFLTEFEFSHENYEQIKEIINNCPLIHNTMKPLWIYMLRLMFQMEKKKTSIYSICLLFPLLESILRYLYCHLNKLDSNRLLTAISREYYVTFYEIFATIITTDLDLEWWQIDSNDLKDFKPNLLVQQFLPQCFNHSFQDLIIWHHGPRLRDRLSHGQIKFQEINIETNFMAKFALISSISFISWLNNNPDNLSFYSIHFYESKYHRLYYLRNEMIKLIKKEFNLLQMILVDDDDDNVQLIIKQKQQNMEQICDLIKKNKIVNLHLHKSHLTMINVLENLCKCRQQFINNLQEFNQNHKQLEHDSLLHTRQRKNFQKFLSISFHKILIDEHFWKKVLIPILSIITDNSYWNEDLNINKMMMKKLMKTSEQLRELARKHEWNRMEDIYQQNLLNLIKLNI